VRRKPNCCACTHPPTHPPHPHQRNRSTAPDDSAREEETIHKAKELEDTFALVEGPFGKDKQYTLTFPRELMAKLLKAVESMARWTGKGTKPSGSKKAPSGKASKKGSK